MIQPIGHGLPLAVKRGTEEDWDDDKRATRMLTTVAHSFPAIFGCGRRCARKRPSVDKASCRRKRAYFSYHDTFLRLGTVGGPTHSLAEVSTPEQKCIGSPEQNYIDDAVKEAPELGAFRQVSGLSGIIHRRI